MTSRERVRKVLAHEQPDRIPNGLGACETAGMHIAAYRRLQEILGVQAPVRMNTCMTNAVFEPELVQAMQGDILLVASPALNTARLRGPHSGQDWQAFTLDGAPLLLPKGESLETEPDGTVWWLRGGKRVFRRPPTGLYFEDAQTENLYADVDLMRPEDFHPASSFGDDALRKWEEAARFCYESTEYALAVGESITDLQAMPGGITNWYIRLMEDEDSAHEILDKCCTAGLNMLRELDEAVGKYADILCIAQDFGDARGVMIGAAKWREIYKPHYKRLFGSWKTITRMKSNLHSCGAISDIVGDLAECGLDILNPVQVSARGMEPAELKRRFGQSLVFYGGAYDAIQTPADTPPQQVYETVKQNIRALAAGGGYLFAGVHNIPADTPKSHLEAMLRAYNDVKSYG